MGREWTISNVQEHYDYNAATMTTPKTENFNFDFSFSNYIHVLYRKNDFIKLEADSVEGIKSWRLTVGGCDARVTGHGGHGGGAGYSFRSQPHVCFCGRTPCPHVAFTGERTEHRAYPCTQEKADREQATEFVGTIVEGTPLASKGDLDDSTSGNEPLWISIAEGKLMVNDKKFTAAGGAGPSSTRTIATGWSYVDIGWLVKIKTDSEGNVHYEQWSQPRGLRTVLTKSKILTVSFKLRTVPRAPISSRAQARTQPQHEYDTNPVPNGSWSSPTRARAT
jgi:hypothetical protein